MRERRKFEYCRQCSGFTGDRKSPECVRRKLKSLDVQNDSEIEAAFLSAIKDRSDAAIVLGSQVVTSYAKQFAAMAVKSRLPAIYWSPEFVQAGALLSYSVSINDLFRRSAITSTRYEGGKAC